MLWAARIVGPARSSFRSRPGRRHRGAALVESVVALPSLLFLVLTIWQAATAYHAKNSVNYAVHEAVRAGSLNNASVDSIETAFRKAMLPYYGGGRDLAELAETYAKAKLDLKDVVRIEIISPTQESFDDYHSPALAKALKLSDSARVIPNVGLDELSCPRDLPSCKSDPKTNASGQSLLDANLLKVRVTYGIPEKKQMPLVGPFITWVLKKMGAGDGDAFKLGLLEAGRIPIVAHATVRMQSDPIRNSKMISSPGPGNDGKPVDPGPPASSPTPMPDCPWWDPSCSACRMSGGTKGCEPDLCPGKP